MNACMQNDLIKITLYSDNYIYVQSSQCVNNDSGARAIYALVLIAANKRFGSSPVEASLTDVDKLPLLVGLFARVLGTHVRYLYSTYARSRRITEAATMPAIAAPESPSPSRFLRESFTFAASASATAMSSPKKQSILRIKS